MSDPKTIIEHFCVICEQVSSDLDLFQSLFNINKRTLDLYESISPFLFTDLNRILQEYLYIQFCKITDRAKTGKDSNITANYIVEEINWPDNVKNQLLEINMRLTKFREHIEPARSKRIVHMDLPAQVERHGNLGAFPQGAEDEFLRDLQTFVNIAYGHFHDGSTRPIRVGRSTDTYQLIRALVKSAVLDRCSKCAEHERNVAVLNYQYSPD